MKSIRTLYGTSLALLTDLYQLTMGYGYWKTGMENRESVFNMFFRKNPFKSGYTVACGLETVIEYLQDFTFTSDDLEFLATLTGNDEKPLFEKGFLDFLEGMEFECDLYAIPEGTFVFPFEPLIRIEGPLIQAQILETVLLNIINFQTLIATKACRICSAADNEPVLEFGLRRAQGIDGSLSASRAAFIGGCAATSNVLAGKLFGIPVKGTHAHSWIMSFDDELTAFETYGSAMPNNSIFLVDTYDTLQGVRNAVTVGKQLREKGYEMIGIRLDSGDLAYLSQEARTILDEGGFPEARIVASNDLDEHIIEALKHQGAEISIWGVGTNLVTAKDQPALGGVYKLAAIKDSAGEWAYKVKLSEQLIKISNPGIIQVKRFRHGSEYAGDVLYDLETELPENIHMIDPMDFTRKKQFNTVADQSEELLVPVFEKGKLVYTPPSLQEIQAKVKDQYSCFHKGIRRFTNPHTYPVGLEEALSEKKIELVEKLRGYEHAPD